MRRPLRSCCCLAALAAVTSPVASQETYVNRLPPQAYRAMVIPPDNPHPPQPPETPQPGCSGSDGRDRSEQCCHGFGCPPAEVDVARQLIAYGPDMSETYPTYETISHQFAVVGFARTGWPLSIEYSAEPDTVTILRIKLYHRRKLLIFPIPFFEVAYQANLDALPAETEFPDPWHRTVTLPPIELSRSADPAADDGLHVARYEVRSYRVADGRITSLRAPVRVLGITVGPEVVGSLSLMGSGFGPGGTTIPARGAPPLEVRYHYRTDKPYDLLKEAVDIYSDTNLAYGPHKQIGAPHSAAQNQLLETVWKVGWREHSGRYRVSVSGWWDCKGTTLAQSLANCPNNPDWAVATSDDLVLTR